MKISDSQKKKIKIVVIVVIIALILWFMVISPILKFKKNEKILENAAKRYYEINTGQLPTGKKIKTVELQTLYDKNFISDDLRSSYTKKVCDIRNSWVKVKKENNDYKYYTYLKCGIFSSKVDHEGPVIKLKGDDLITINKGEKFKDPGIDSVSDNTDGKMDIKDVVIDSKKLNVNKIGTYEITYKVKDSFNNETVKIRTVKVTETLNHIVKKDTKGKNVYQGTQYNNYVKIDGILFRIVGINEDGSVKLVSSENLASVNYDGVDSWLNDYFYEKLSDSAKKLIVKQKFCNEEVNDPDNYKKCNKYSKKQYVGLLSVADINNSKDKDGSTDMISVRTLLFNLSSKNKAISYMTDSFVYNSKKENVEIRPVISIKNDTIVKQGDGSKDVPYVLKGNKNRVKVGDLISKAHVGDYINYSGYLWRVIDLNNDGTTNVIMNDVVKNGDLVEYIGYDDQKIDATDKNSVAYSILNKSSRNVNTKYLSKRIYEIKKYTNEILYNNESKILKIETKYFIPSIYDLFSASYYQNYWYSDLSEKNKNCYMNYYGSTDCSKFSKDVKAIRLIGSLSSNIKVKSGNGTFDEPYIITK